MAKITVQGEYQYSEATIKDVAALRSFGWLAGRKTEHENKKGEKVYTIRRDIKFAQDSQIRAAERKYNDYKDKAAKKMKTRHIIGQIFAILVAIVTIISGAVMLLCAGKGVVGEKDKNIVAVYMWGELKEGEQMLVDVYIPVTLVGSQDEIQSAAEEEQKYMAVSGYKIPSKKYYEINNEAKKYSEKYKYASGTFNPTKNYYVTEKLRYATITPEEDRKMLEDNFGEVIKSIEMSKEDFNAYVAEVKTNLAAPLATVLSNQYDAKIEKVRFEGQLQNKKEFVIEEEVAELERQKEEKTAYENIEVIKNCDIYLALFSSYLGLKTEYPKEPTMPIEPDPTSFETVAEYNEAVLDYYDALIDYYVMEYQYTAIANSISTSRFTKFYSVGFYTRVALKLGGIINKFYPNGKASTVEPFYQPKVDIVKLANLLSYIIPVCLLVCGVISIISIVVNSKRYKKRLIYPKRKYVAEYRGQVMSAMQAGAERVFAMKNEDRYLMTRSDIRMNDLSNTFSRIMREEFE